MAKGSTNIIGLTPDWRENTEYDSYRVQVCKDGEKIWVSAKVHPTLRQLNQHLRSHKLKREQAEADDHVRALIGRLHQELAAEHGLKHYRAIERVELNRKSFNFEESLTQFFEYKRNTAIPAEYVATLKRVWIPFFLSKGAEHPGGWKQHRKHAEIHLHAMTKVNSDEKYSAESKVKIAAALNQYLEFLLWNEDIDASGSFAIRATITLEDRKRGRGNVTKREVYGLDELARIREKIDEQYANDLKMKLRAYALLLGPITGLRKGNLLGLRARNLHPDAETPHFETEDNIVSGWGRGQKGKLTLKYSTKTIVGTVKLPLLQPTKEFAIEVCRFIKANIRPEDYILYCNPHTVGRWWSQIAEECGFRDLNPHAWRHGYATHGAAHLHDWYGGNPYFLQKCCTHEDFKTTQKYIDQTGDSFLAAFRSAQSTAR